MVDYTHSAAENINWPGQKNVYNVRVITQDRVLTEAFQNLANTKKIKGKDINVTFSSYVSIPQSVDILFVSSLYNGALQSIVDRISGKPVLIVTENSLDQQYVMMNFIQVGGRLTFEYNRANIINQGLEVTPNFNSIGGTEIDVAKLYKQFRDSVRAMESRTKAVQERMDSLNMNTAVAFRIASDQLRQLDEQEKEIERRQEQLDNQTEVLDSLTVEFNNSQAKLTELTGELTVLEDEVQAQEASIEEGNKTLKEQEELIEKRNKQIADSEDQLERMGVVVDTQQDTLILLILFSVFLVVVLIFAYRAYQARRRDAKKLNEQKEELKELLDELQSTQTQLVQSEKMASLGVLTAGIAHEINNAINYVYSGIHVLDSKFSEIKPVIGILKDLNGDENNFKEKMKLIEEKKKEVEYDESEGVIDTMISSIRVGAERTTEIVKGLRTFSREESENMQEIDIHQDINVALLLLKNKIKHDIKIDQFLAVQLPTVYGYPGQLGQAILNIIGNAIDAVSKKGTPGKIIIQTVHKNDRIEITVRDNGVGIAPENLDKIFDPFFTTKNIGEGTGLGLSITFGIIEKHHGSIDVRSKLGKGTEFRIKLPLNDQPQTNELR